MSRARQCSGPTCDAWIFDAPTHTRARGVWNVASVARNEGPEFTLRGLYFADEEAGFMRPAQPDDPGPFWMSHWATCADRDHFKAKGITPRSRKEGKP